MLHQYKETAPITYLDSKGNRLDAPDDDIIVHIGFDIKSLSILQTLVNRSYTNCNCNLDKKVLHGLKNNIKLAIDHYTELKGKNNDS
jgi:hypothetical protein